mmetsp:Transcript_63239/g.119668  ORF Transcript_63239/g.119668 Transcript_63239/m.119668 type:complete len:1114 (+) Transcript_63239:29-3370(+)
MSSPLPAPEGRSASALPQGNAAVSLELTEQRTLAMAAPGMAAPEAVVNRESGADAQPALTPRAAYGQSGRDRLLEDLASMTLAERPWRRRACSDGRRKSIKTRLPGIADAAVRPWQCDISDGRRSNPMAPERPQSCDERPVGSSPVSLSPTKPLSDAPSSATSSPVRFGRRLHLNASLPGKASSKCPVVNHPEVKEQAIGDDVVSLTRSERPSLNSTADTGPELLHFGMGIVSLRPESSLDIRRAGQLADADNSTVGSQPPEEIAPSTSSRVPTPRLLAEIPQASGKWDPKMWLKAREEIVQSSDVRHIHELRQRVYLSTEQAVRQQSYCVGSQVVKLDRPGLGTGIHWFGQANAGPEADQKPGTVPPPLLVCAMSPLDVIVKLRDICGNRRPLVLVAELNDFHVAGSADFSQPSCARPQCLPLRTNFGHRAHEAGLQLRGSAATVRSHLCAQRDPYVFLSPDVLIFRGSREEGFPFLSEPVKTHVIATAEVDARPEVQTLLGIAGKTEWYSDEAAHQALLERLHLISLVALNKLPGGSTDGEAGPMSADERPVLILGTFGCGGGRAGRHPHHAIANALKHWRREFSALFHSVFVCCEGDNARGDSNLAALMDRIVNRQVYRALNSPLTASNMLPWHWDPRQIELCVRPQKLQQVFQMYKLWNQKLVGAAEVITDDAEAAKGDAGDCKNADTEEVANSAMSTAGTLLMPADPQLQLQQQIRRASVVAASLASSCLECNDKDSAYDDSSDSEKDAPTCRSWVERSLQSHSSRRNSSVIGSQTMSRRASLARSTSAEPPAVPRRMSLVSLGWKPGHSRRSSMNKSRRSSSADTAEVTGSGKSSRRASLAAILPGAPNSEGNGPRRHSISGLGSRRHSLVGTRANRRFSLMGTELPMTVTEEALEDKHQDDGDNSPDSDGCTSSRSATSRLGEDDDTPLDKVQANRNVQQLAQNVEDIELLRRDSFQELHKELHKEQTRNLRRRSTIHDLLGTGDISSLVVADRHHSSTSGSLSARSHPRAPQSAASRAKANVSDHELEIRRQVRERLRKRRETVRCKGPGSLVFAKHQSIPGSQDGGDDNVDEKPQPKIAPEEQLAAGRRLSIFSTLSSGRNLLF